MEKVFSVDDETADSDEAFLEQAKLRAHETLQNALLGDDAAADSDYTVVEQAKLKHAKTLENTLLDGQQAKDWGGVHVAVSGGTQYIRQKLSSFG